MDNTLANFKEIDEMLDGDPEAMKEFYEAAIISFSDFCNDYKTCMNNRDFEELRKVGHRIRPAAQMLGLDLVNKKYEDAKQLLQNDASDEELKTAVDEVDTLCSKIVENFKDKISRIQQ